MDGVLRRTATALLIGGVGLGLAGCGPLVTGKPQAAPSVAVGEADVSIVRGTDGGRIDQIAAATVIDVQDYWRQTFESAFGKPWHDVRGFYSVDTADPTAKPAPCTEDASDVEGNAFYCPAADSIAYDRAALFPVLVEKFGEAGVVVVLAHEIGHAVHNRLGIDSNAQRRAPQLYPTIVVEAMADCYAGSFLRWVADGKAAHLRVNTGQLDAALGSLVNFRDPVGTSAGDRGAHGNAFDRVSSFQDGFQRGPKLCSQFTAETRQFTLREFTNQEDADRGGNLPLPKLVEDISGDLDSFFATLVRARGGSWTDPQLRPDPDCSGDQGPVAFCPRDRSVGVDVGSRELNRLHQIGDYATGTLLATRYGLAALVALGKSAEGEQAARAGLCLAGAYTGDLLGRRSGFGLSPGDLDEAVVLLLRYDYPVRDADGNPAAGSAFDRVGLFRGGTLDGADACELS
ncbi:MAG TPA: neutral zinc metallopeptidase [Pseudonocardiaceae bacterium]